MRTKWILGQEKKKKSYIKFIIGQLETFEYGLRLK